MPYLPLLFSFTRSLCSFFLSRLCSVSSFSLHAFSLQTSFFCLSLPTSSLFLTLHHLSCFLAFSVLFFYFIFCILFVFSMFLLTCFFPLLFPSFLYSSFLLFLPLSFSLLLRLYFPFSALCFFPSFSIPSFSIPSLFPHLFQLLILTWYFRFTFPRLFPFTLTIYSFPYAVFSPLLQYPAFQSLLSSLCIRHTYFPNLPLVLSLT